jgi:hypothetical protein
MSMKATLELDPVRLLGEVSCRGWSAITLAQSSGLNVATVRRAMRGDGVSPSTLFRIAEALQWVEPDPFLSRLMAEPRRRAEEDY